MTDSGAAVTVDFRVALTFDIGEWENAFLYALERLRREVGDALRLADQSAERVDILVIIYQGTDHDAISTKRTLERLLAAYPRPVSRLCVYACGRTRGRGTLGEGQVRELLHDQSTGFAVDVPIAGRALHPDAFGDALREELMREIRRRNLLGPTRADGVEVDQSLESDVSWDALSL